MYHFLVLVLKILIGWKVKVLVEGQQNIPTEGPVIVAFHHTDFLDTLAIMFAIPRDLVAFMAYEYRNNPIVIPFKLIGHVIFVKRGERDVDARKKAIKYLNQKKWLVISPKGTRGTRRPEGPDNVGSGKYGTGYIALNARQKVLILPVGIVGAVGAFTRLLTTWPWKPIVITVRIGQPFYLKTEKGVDYSNLDKEKIGELTEMVNRQIMPEIAKLLPERMRGEFGS